MVKVEEEALGEIINLKIDYFDIVYLALRDLRKHLSVYCVQFK